jgi:hypothetical protein
MPTVDGLVQSMTKRWIMHPPMRCLNGRCPTRTTEPVRLPSMLLRTRCGTRADKPLLTLHLDVEAEFDDVAVGRARDESSAFAYLVVVGVGDGTSDMPA